MPANPPITDSSIASTRNCSMIWMRRAPIAMRIPISRVRSVTDTSMMFMIPMPPTSSEIDATDNSSIVITCVALSDAAAISLEIAHGEIVVLLRPGYDAARAGCRVICAIALSTCVRAARLDEHRIHDAGDFRRAAEWAGRFVLEL